MKAKPKALCLVCGNTCKRTTTKFCSKECYWAYRTTHKKRYGGPRKRLVDKECPWCNKMFSPIRATSRFCSHRCAGKYRFHIDKEQEFMKRGVEKMKNLTPQEKAKYAEMAAKARRSAPEYTKGLGGIREDLGHYVRSRWEANICRWLAFLGIKYEYEPDVFRLVDGLVSLDYTPDIKISDKVYIEVKGWETGNSKRKRHLMSWQHPEVSIMYIEEAQYKDLSKEFKNIVPGWEYDSRHGR